MEGDAGSGSTQEVHETTDDHCGNEEEACHTDHDVPRMCQLAHEMSFLR
jgi:hypothetical protein